MSWFCSRRLLASRVFWLCRLRVRDRAIRARCWRWGTSLQALLAGADAWAFWGVFGCVGLAAPLAMALASICLKPSPLIPFAQAACALAGAFAMRWSITAAGMHPILQSAGLS